jgi:hypothetical protein
MRGCLFIVALGGVVLALVVILAVPAFAASLIGASLGAAGLESDDTQVDVVGDGPLGLLGGTAATVRVRADNATFRNMAIASLDITLRDVSLLSRRAEGLTGRLDGVIVPGDGGAAGDDGINLRRIVLEGPTANVRAVALVDAAEVLVLVSDGVHDAIGLRPRDVRLDGADRLTIDLTLFQVRGSLAINEAGALVLRASEGPFAGTGGIILFEPGRSVPLRLTAVRVVPDGLELTGRLTERLLP